MPAVNSPSNKSRVISESEILWDNVEMKSPKLPQNSVGNSRGILKNQIGTIGGMLGTIGSPLVKPKIEPTNPIKRG